ncbi:MAG: DUF4129 domain-containing protein [Chloroflexi bacterium]|nr:MAG: DUF4129 domain-containing protein [Chloroflexota bacterium]
MDSISRFVSLLWVFGCLLMLAMPAQTAVSQPLTPNPQSLTPISEADFWQLITDTQTAVSTLPNESPETQRERLDALAADLMAVTAVSRNDGQVVPVNLTFFANQLQAEAPNLAQIDARLQTLLDVRDQWPEVQFDGTETAVLTTILAQPEFIYETAEPTWLAKQWQALMAKWQEFLSRFTSQSSTEGSGGVGSTILTIIISLIVAAILVYIINDLVGDFAGEARLATEAAESGEPLTAEAALQRAQSYSGAGDYRTAIRYLYLSALLLLEERNLLRYDRSLTNREYLKSIAHLPELATILRDMIDVFDRAWYGFQNIDEQTYQRYVNQVNQLKQQKRDA